MVLASLAARGWLLIGVAAIGFGAIATGDAKIAPVAIALGGVLLVYRALRSMVNGATRVVAAGRAAWQLRALLRAADRSDPPVSPRHAVRPEDSSGKTALLAAHQVGMSYPGRARPVLVDCSVSLAAGDRLLVLGPSGAGKTTLASLLSGSQQPTHGLLLLDGMDYASLRGFWRRWVVAVPQFNDNHVFHGSLAFNLLLGREWPPRRQMLVEAEALCRELHLGPLLDKMPAGLEQIVGEVGWQLSHGEQSRLFVARALLQRPDVVILDESFGALDPESLRSCFETVLARARTLVLIAHP
jgi:ATP-binding cassette subfamily B protein